MKDVCLGAQLSGQAWKLLARGEPSEIPSWISLIIFFTKEPADLVNWRNEPKQPTDRLTDQQQQRAANKLLWRSLKKKLEAAI